MIKKTQKSTDMAKWASLVLAPVLLGAGVASAQDAPNNGEPVVACTTTSIEGLFFQTIPAESLRKLGYIVEKPRVLSVPLLYQALATGDCDIAVDGVFPSHESFFEPVASAVSRLGPTIAVQKQGYLIDRVTAEKHGITSLEQFKDPSIAALFDTDGNGKANLAGANPGWGAEKTINAHLDKIGLRDTIDHDQGEYSVLIADTFARFKRGEPVFFYTWTPNWTTSAMGAGTDTIWLTVSDKYCTGSCEGSTTGFPINSVWTLANSEFLDQNPKAKTLLGLVSIPPEDIDAENVLIWKGENTEADVLRHVSDWFTTNASVVEGWLATAETN